MIALPSNYDAVAWAKGQLDALATTAALTDLRLALCYARAGGLIAGATQAGNRLLRAPHARYLGTNGYGDHVFALGRLPRERGAKRLHLHTFAKRRPSGAYWRMTVAAEP